MRPARAPGVWSKTALGSPREASLSAMSLGRLGDHAFTLPEAAKLLTGRAVGGGGEDRDNRKEEGSGVSAGVGEDRGA